MLVPPFTNELVGIALPGNDPALVNLGQNVLTVIARSGRLEELRDRWFKDSSWLLRLR